MIVSKNNSSHATVCTLDSVIHRITYNKPKCIFVIVIKRPLSYLPTRTDSTFSPQDVFFLIRTYEYYSWYTLAGSLLAEDNTKRKKKKTRRLHTKKENEKTLSKTKTKRKKKCEYEYVQIATESPAAAMLSTGPSAILNGCHVTRTFLKRELKITTESCLSALHSSNASFFFHLLRFFFLRFDHESLTLIYQFYSIFCT